jgi:PRTRC genetic system protein A
MTKVLTRKILSIPKNSRKKSMHSVTQNPSTVTALAHTPVQQQTQMGFVPIGSTTPTSTPAPAPDLKAVMLEAAQSMVSFKVLSPFASCLVEPHQLEEALASDYNEIYIYVNGTYFKHMKLSNGRYVQIKVSGLPDKYKDIGKELEARTPIVKEHLNFLPAGKIPYAYWEQIVEFFRQVMKHKKADMEAHAWILWEEEKGYYISVPKQTVGKASVAFTYDADALPPGAVIVVDIHSHNTMGAFYSGTDDANDKIAIYYSGVVGKITDANYEWVMRFNLHDTKRKVELEEIFQMQQVVPIPQNWLDQVEVVTHSGKGYQGRSYNGYQGMVDYSQYSSNSKDKSGNVKGNDTTNGVGTTPANPAKWSFPMSQGIVTTGTGGAGSKESGEATFPESYQEWASREFDFSDGGLYVGNGAIQSVPEGTPSHIGSITSKNAHYDESRQVFMEAGRKKEIEELLRDVPGIDEDLVRLDAQATAWLEKQGYDADGNDILTNARSEEEGFGMGQTHEVRGELIEDDPVTEESVRNMPLQIMSEIGERVVATHGREAAHAYELFDADITKLEGADEALMDIAKQCYGLMSEEARSRLESNGF